MDAEKLGLKKWYFTFMPSQEDKKNCYHVIEADTMMAARAIMFIEYGDQWFTSYASAEEAGVDRFNLTEI